MQQDTGIRTIHSCAKKLQKEITEIPKKSAKIFSIIDLLRVIIKWDLRNSKDLLFVTVSDENVWRPREGSFSDFFSHSLIITPILFAAKYFWSGHYDFITPIVFLANHVPQSIWIEIKEA